MKTLIKLTLKRYKIWFGLLLLELAALMIMITELKAGAEQMEGLGQLLKVGLYLNSYVLPISATGANALLWTEEFSRRRMELYVAYGMKRKTIFYSKLLIGLVWSFLGVVLFIAGICLFGYSVFGTVSIAGGLPQLLPSITLYVGIAVFLNSVCAFFGILFRKSIKGVILPAAVSMLWDRWREIFGEDNISEIVMLQNWNVAVRLFCILGVCSVILCGLGYRFIQKRDFR